MTKSKFKITQVNCTTGEEIVRDASDEEIAQIELDFENAKARKAEAEAKAAQRQSILDKLGLTDDEARLLLG